MRRFIFVVLALVLFLGGGGRLTAGYSVTNLVSDVPGLARFTDADLVNPWGVSFPATGPFWVSDNGTGLATLYSGAGVKQGLVVTMPDHAPITGQVFNGTSGVFNGDLFLFAAENGGIFGWRGALGTTAETLLAPSSNVYKGLAINGSTLYAARFSNGAVSRGQIDVFAGGFGSPLSVTDPTVPNDYGVFNVQRLNGKVYVTFAEQDPTSPGDDLAGAGHGFVDVLDPSTNTLTRLISNGPLNSPWGLAIAPSNFGEFSGDLLVGNFGDGRINAFDPVTGAFLGTLTDANGNPIQIGGLWALSFGNGGTAGPTNRLFFTAGIGDEQHGLFGSIDAVPEPASGAALAVGGLVLLAYRWRSRRR
jgi:uncharacterized protein (TIGR03118 family)